MDKQQPLLGSSDAAHAKEVPFNAKEGQSVHTAHNSHVWQLNQAGSDTIFLQVPSVKGPNNIPDLSLLAARMATLKEKSGLFDNDISKIHEVRDSSLLPEVAQKDLSVLEDQFLRARMDTLKSMEATKEGLRASPSGDGISNSNNYSIDTQKLPHHVKKSASKQRKLRKRKTN